MLHRRNNVGQQLSTLLDVTCYTDATMLANKSQHCWMLHVVSVCTPCCMLLRKVWNRSNFWANNSQHFFHPVIAEAQQCWVPVHSSSNIAHYTWSTWRLQGLMGCILPTMHCRSKHCRKLSHPFAHHCQHGGNNSQHCWQHCWPNFARSFKCKI